MALDTKIRKIGNAITIVLTGIFILVLASKYDGITNDMLSDFGWELAMGGVLTFMWILFAYGRRHPEVFSDYYYVE